MDTIPVPEDLTELDDDALTALREQLGARVEELADAELNEDNINEIERLSQGADRIDAETSARSEQAAERMSRREQALAKFRGEGPADELDGDEDEDDENKDDDETKVPEPQTETGEPASVAASARKGSAAGLANRQSPATKAKPGSAEAVMVATAHARNKRESDRFANSEEVAESIFRTRQAYSNVPAGVSEFVPIATGMKEGFAESIGQDATENFAVLRQLQEDVPSLVASGPACTPLSPLYDFFRLAEAQTPVEDYLPSVQAPRGGIRFITPPDFTRVAGAIGVEGVDFTQTSTTAPDLKPCLHVDCPEVEDEFVSAVSQCVTYGNLHYRTFPEQVAAFLEDVGVAFASRKEVFYLDYIDANSTGVSGVATGYGAFRQLLFSAELAAVAYRKRQGMKRGAVVHYMLPDWVCDEVKTDLAMGGHQGLDYLSITDEQVQQAFRTRGIEPVWYNDSATGRAQKFNEAQAANAVLRSFPVNAVGYLFAPGTFVRLDGGTLDVGLVRDSTLNRTNDVQLFMEEWLGMAKLGLQSLRVVTPLCPNGTAAQLVTPFTC